MRASRDCHGEISFRPEDRPCLFLKFFFFFFLGGQESESDQEFFEEYSTSVVSSGFSSAIMVFLEPGRVMWGG